MNKDTKDNNTHDEYEQHVAEAGGDYRVETSKMQNAVAKVLCVLAAILLWFYVASDNMTVDERSFTALPVAIHNRDTLAKKDLGEVIKGTDYTVDVTLKGSKADLERLSADKIVFFVDVGSINEAGAQYLEIQSSLPKGITLVDQSMSMLPVYIDKNITKNVKVELDLEYTAEWPIYIEESECRYDELLEITGPAQELERISHALISLNLGENVSNTKSTTGRPVLIDENGAEVDSEFISMQNTSVKVYVPVYTEKDVPLAAKFKHGYLKLGENAEVDIQPATVRIKGDPTVINSISEMALAAIDETAITDNDVMEQGIKAIEGVEVLGGISTAAVDLTHIGTTTVTLEMKLDRFSPPNDPNNIYSVYNRIINVTFRVPEEMLKTEDAEPIITDDDVYIEIDYSGLSIMPGGHNVPVSVEVTNKELRDKVYAIGEYVFYVEINER